MSPRRIRSEEDLLADVDSRAQKVQALGALASEIGFGVGDRAAQGLFVALQDHARVEHAAALAILTIPTLTEEQQDDVVGALEDEIHGYGTMGSKGRLSWPSVGSLQAPSAAQKALARALQTLGAESAEAWSSVKPDDQWGETPLGTEGIGLLGNAFYLFLPEPYRACAAWLADIARASSLPSEGGQRAALDEIDARVEHLRGEAHDALQGFAHASSLTKRLRVNPGRRRVRR